MHWFSRPTSLCKISNVASNKDILYIMNWSKWTYLNLFVGIWTKEIQVFKNPVMFFFWEKASISTLLRDMILHWPYQHRFMFILYIIVPIRSNSTDPRYRHGLSCDPKFYPVFQNVSPCTNVAGNSFLTSFRSSNSS